MGSYFWGSIIEIVNKKYFREIRKNTLVLFKERVDDSFGYFQTTDLSKKKNHCSQFYFAISLVPFGKNSSDGYFKQRVEADESNCRGLAGSGLRIERWWSPSFSNREYRGVSSMQPCN